MSARSLSGVLDVCESWPVEHVSAGVTDSSSTLAVHGDPDVIYRLASISKVFAAWACLVAAEEGSVSLDDAVGPPGATLRHCLSHAAGYGFDGPDPIAGVAARRIYSNTGIETACDFVAHRTGMPFGEYLTEAVFRPLGLDRTQLLGSPAHGVHGCVRDMLVFIRELLDPTLVSPASAAEAFRIQFPDLAGIIPGIGRFDPNSWGLGLEIHGAKAGHWMGSRTSPATGGHFGGAGTMFWVDPRTRIGLVALTDTPFDEWADVAPRAWSDLSDAVVAHCEHG